MGILSTHQERALVKCVDKSNQALVASLTLLQITKQLGVATDDQAILEAIDTAAEELGKVVDGNRTVISQIAGTLS